MVQVWARQGLRGIAACARLWQAIVRTASGRLMADYAHRRTVMVDTQVRPSDVTKFPIIQAMLTVPREDFVPATGGAGCWSRERLPRCLTR